MASFFNMRGTSSNELQLGVKGPKLKRTAGDGHLVSIESSDGSTAPELSLLNGKISLSAAGYINASDYTGNAATATSATKLDMSAPAANTNYYLVLTDSSSAGVSKAYIGSVHFYNGNLYLNSVETSNRLMTKTASDDLYVDKTSAQTISGAKTFTADITTFKTISATGTAGIAGNLRANGVNIGLGNEIWANTANLHLNYRTGSSGIFTDFASTFIDNGERGNIASFIGADTNIITLTGSTTISGNFAVGVGGNTPSDYTMTLNGEAIATQNWANPKFVTGLSVSDNKLNYTINGTTTSLTIPYASSSYTATKTSNILTINNNGAQVKAFDGSLAKTVNLSSLLIKSAGNTTGDEFNPYNSDDSSNTKTSITISRVASADKLTTARALWGNSFDGSAIINGDIVPAASKSLGSTSIPFANLYVKDIKSADGGTASLVDLNMSGGVTTNLNPKISGSNDLGSSSLKWKDGYFSGTVTAASFAGNASSATKVGHSLTIKLGSGNSDVVFTGEETKIADIGALIDSLNPFEYKSTLVIGSTGIAATPAASKGDVYIIATGANTPSTGSYYLNSSTDAVEIEAGDMIICNADSTTAGTTANWDVINKNITGAVTEANFSANLKKTLYGANYPATGVAIVNGSTGVITTASQDTFVTTNTAQDISGVKRFTGSSLYIGTASAGATLAGSGTSLNIDKAIISTGTITSGGTFATSGTNLVLAPNSGNVYVSSVSDSTLVIKRGDISSAISGSGTQYRTLTLPGNSNSAIFSLNTHTHTALESTALVNATATDLNNYKTSGIYTAAAGSTSITSMPSATAGTKGFVLEVIQGASSNVTQRVSINEATEPESVLWMRSFNGTTWSAWVNAADTSKFLRLTGGTLSGALTGTTITANTQVVATKIANAEANPTAYVDLSQSTTGALYGSAVSKLAVGTSSSAYLTSSNFKLFDSTTTPVFDFSISNRTLTAKGQVASGSSSAGSVALSFPATTAIALAFPTSSGTLARIEDVNAVDSKLSNYVTNTTLANYSTTNTNNGLYAGLSNFNTLSSNYNTFVGTTYPTDMAKKSATGHTHKWLFDQVITSSKDLNTISYSAPSDSTSDGTDNGTGWYYCNAAGTSSATNVPSDLTSGGAFSLEVIRADASAKVTQRLTDSATGRTWVRTGSGSSWGDWAKTVLPDDITNATSGYLTSCVKKAGDTMTGTLNMGGNPIRVGFLQNTYTSRETSMNFAHAYGNTGSPTIRFDLMTTSAFPNGTDFSKGYLSDGYVTTFMWDNNSEYDTQIFVPNNTTSNGGRLAVRNKNGSPSWPANATDSGAWKTIPLYSDILPISGGTMTGVLNLKANQYEGNYALNANNSNLININSMVLADSDNANGLEGFISPRSDNTARYDSISLYNGEAYLTRNLSSIAAATLDGSQTRSKFVINGDSTATISKIYYSSSTSGPSTYGTSTTGNLYLQTPTNDISAIGTSAGKLFNHALRFPGGTTSLAYTYTFPSKDATLAADADVVTIFHILDSHKSSPTLTFPGDGKTVTMDIGTLLASYDTTTNLALCSKKTVAENFNVKKSFGQGITIGTDTATDTTGDTTTYKSAGCSMTYDAAEKCMRFTFA